MIAKGSSRSGPKQLAVYLMRVGRYDTGEPAELLELQSPWAALENGTRERTAAKLIEAFRDWQMLAEGTRQGEYGLYHAQISPAPKYAQTMTPEQWKRAADMLGEELGLQDQPRALVLHGGKDDRHHLHVVWSRTDIEEMKLRSDSFNYQAHERASMRMEKEFGQEFVPGKHAKRDRELQPEFPRQEMDHDEAQQAERLKLTKEERVAQLASIRKSCDDGQAFKNALEEAGYVVAKGDRGFILVDEAGEIFSLSKYSPDLKGKAYKAYMASVNAATLPTVEEAKELQEQRVAVRAQAAEEVKEQTPIASKFLPPDLAKKIEPPPIDVTLYAPKPQPSKFLPPDLAQKIEPPPIDVTLYAPKPQPSKFLPPDVVPAPVPAAPEPSNVLPKEPQAAPEEPKPYDWGLYAKKPVPAPEVTPLPPPPAPEEEPSRRAKIPIDPERKTHITSLRVWADGAEDFKRALQDAGYTLAAGKGGYTLVDHEGKVFNLFAHIPENKIRLEAFMSPIPLSSLPTVKQVWEDRKRDPEVWQPPPPIADTPAGWAPKDQELYDLERAIAARAAEDMEKLKELHARQILATRRWGADRREIVEKMRGI